MDTVHDGARELLSEVLERLEGELREATRARDEVEAEYRARIEPLSARVRSLEITVSHQREALEHYRGESKATARESSDKLSDVAFGLMQEIGQPVHYRTLAQRLTESGTSIAGKDPGTVLINYLRREPERFCRTAKPGYYALVKWGLEDAKPVSGERTRSTGKKRATKKQPGRRRSGGTKK